MDWDTSLLSFIIRPPPIGHNVLKFIVHCFAVIGFLIVSLIVWGVYMAVQQKETIQKKPANIVLTLDFNNPIVEQTDSTPFSFALDEEPMALLNILKAIDRAAKDPNVKGIAARFGSNQPTMAQAQEIRAALARFRETGKFTYAFGTDYGQFGLGNRAYYLASAFENIWLQPVGTVSLTGVTLISPFAKTALDKIGVVADFMQREEYKSLMEPGQRDSFSPQVKEEMQTLVNGLSDQIAEGIATSRKWDLDHVRDLMKRGPFVDEEAVQEGLVTKLAYADEFEDELERKAGDTAESIDPVTYIGFPEPKKADAPESTSIAVIYGTGIIMDKGVEGSDLTGEPILGADVIVDAFAEASENEDIKAILFRIDSPGGSPAASESIRRAMIQAQKLGKPVIVSMGETAASGGYWIAMNGDKIIATPATLTGSIGVVAGKFSFDGLLQKLGVTMDGVSTSANAGMWNMMTTFSPEQRTRVEALLDNTYRSFVNNVATARKIPAEKMPDIAKGRVFTGDQALKIGLVDTLGGYKEALDAIREALKLDPKAEIVMETYPTPPTPVERLVKVMRRLGAEGANAFSARAALAPLASVLGPFHDIAAFSRQPVMLRMQPMESLHE